MNNFLLLLIIIVVMEALVILAVLGARGRSSEPQVIVVRPSERTDAGCGLVAALLAGLLAMGAMALIMVLMIRIIL